jgi:hypothetical protein
MKRTFLALAVVLLVGSAALAQQPMATLQTPQPAGEQFVAPNVSLPAVTPEVWLYSQEWQRHDDPKQAVRRKAEARTAARMQRLEAMRWFGMSNARPQASVTPFMGVYSPAWVGNGYDRYDWVGASAWPITTVRVENYEVRR